VKPGDGPLLQHLKDWRRRQATSQGVPPYVVFHDRTLVEVVQGRPACLEELGQISGVGQLKLERYGLDLLQALQDAIASLDQAPAP
jgi:ATP-dependent DNA helicase RecQ